MEAGRSMAWKFSTTMNTAPYSLADRAAACMKLSMSFPAPSTSSRNASATGLAVPVQSRSGRRLKMGFTRAFTIREKWFR